jgi:peptidoglycan-associated lipoprotein
MALGDARAKAAKEYLVGLGIPGNQLATVTYGKERPVCTEQTEDCWQKNRRAHVNAQN